jgi:exopolyphosphatase/guanosine-5'-triphosphate,3'-diphosphate pyrophosphatase
MAVCAAIDVGTNTIRLLVAEPVGTDDFRLLHQAQEVTRLGEGMMPARRLQENALRRSLTVLRRFAESAREFGAEQVVVVGTSAVREALNRDEFVREVARETGLALRVIDGDEEARLTLLGVRHGLSLASSRVLVMDIGGGSTEFVLGGAEVIEGLVSTGLGVVKLTEAHIASDPPTGEEVRALEQVIASRLEQLRRELPGVEGTRLVATAGTPTTLAAIDLGLTTYDRQKVHGHRLSRDRIKALYTDLARRPLADRRRIPGLEPARADVILAGAAILVAAMEQLDYPEMQVSDDGLREGVLLDLLRNR